MDSPFKSLGADLRTGEATLVMADGRSRTVPTPLTREALGVNITAFNIDFTDSELTLGLPNGADVLAEIERPGGSDIEALAGRKVIYLDQRDWSRIAAARHGTATVTRAEALAAQQIAELIDSGLLVAPLSSAHVIEHDPLVGEKREALASTMLELSRGWQMRHPLSTGRDELAAALELGPAPAKAGVFTLTPNAMFLHGRRIADSSLPAPFDQIIPVVSALTGTYDAILDDTPTAEEGREQAAGAWVASQEDLLALLAAEGASPERTRAAALARLLADSVEHLALSRPGRLAQETFGAWLPRAGEDVAAMPYLSRSWQLHYARLRNGSRWVINDLIDIHNLCAAAGYADVVVGERRTIGELRASRGVPQGAVLTTSLAEAVLALTP